MTMTRLRNSWIADLMPPMPEKEYIILRDSIRDHGLLDPIWLYNGEILDGRHRYQACLETGRPLLTRAYEGDEPIAFATQINVNRRHLPLKPRCILGVRLLPEYREEAARRQRHADVRTGFLSEDEKPATGGVHVEIGRLVNVSPTTMERAIELATKADELWADVTAPDSKLTITGAWRRYKGIPLDGRSPGKPRDFEVIEVWEVPEPQTQNISVWQDAFAEQKRRAAVVANERESLRGQLVSVNSEISRRARDMAAADYQKIVRNERTRAAAALALAEKRMSHQQALAVTRMSTQQFQDYLAEMRGYIGLTVVPNETELSG